MISRIRTLWLMTYSSLWFVPAMFCLVYSCITLILHNLETHYLAGTPLPPFLFKGNLGDAQNIILALLASMITMATLSVSITMVVLSMAATQLGPRLIRTFMGDPITQNFIGMFFGAVVSCFILTIILHNIDAEAAHLMPRLTLSAIFLVCSANLFVLLAFVNHVGELSIADRPIHIIAAHLIRSIHQLPNRIADTADNQDIILYGKTPPENWPQDFDHKAHILSFSRSAYVQFINYKALLHLAEKHDLYITLKIRAGKFVLEYESGIFVYSTAGTLDKKLTKSILACFTLGLTQSPIQDIEYSIRHLVEIGTHALSVGVNDNFTALSVLDHLSAALEIIFRKQMPPEWYYDHSGTPRLHAQQSDHHRIIMQAFNQIRFNIGGQPDVIYHMLQKLEALAKETQTAEQRQSLRQQVEEIDYIIDHMAGVLKDTATLKELCHIVKQKLDNQAVTKA